MELIDKSALAAELERMLQNEYPCDNSEQETGYSCALYELQDFLGTLEVKEVGEPSKDLEKHLKEDIEDVYFDLNGVAVKGATYYLTVEDIKEIAKHFFELGLNTKGE